MIYCGCFHYGCFEKPTSWFVVKDRAEANSWLTRFDVHIYFKSEEFIIIRTCSKHIDSESTPEVYQEISAEEAEVLMVMES